MMILNKRMSDRLNEDIVLRESRKTVMTHLIQHHLIVQLYAHDYLFLTSYLFFIYVMVNYIFLN